jgi:hypothetical protein
MVNMHTNRTIFLLYNDNQVMKYAFVCLSVVAIWAAVIVMGLVAPGADLLFLHHVALAMTVVLFWIGFKVR